jgi:hypothetical protein
VVLKQAGVLTGGYVRCVLRVPSLGLHENRSFRFPDKGSRLRLFLQKWIPAAQDDREGATFVIRAEVRYCDSHGYRWVVLCRWQAGESIHRALDEATANWKRLYESSEILEQSAGN